MPWLAAGAAVVSAGVGAYGSSQQAGATKDASNAAIRAQQEQQDQNQRLASPWIQQGTNALSWISDLSGMNGPEQAAARAGSFMQDPGRQFQVDQALRAVDAGAASRGMLGSGATIAAEQARASDLANQSFGQWYNRLAGIADSGRAEVNALAGVGTTAASGVADTYRKEGNTLASIYGNESAGLSGTVNALAKNWDYLSKQNGTNPLAQIGNWLGGGGGSDVGQGAAYRGVDAGTAY